MADDPAKKPETILHDENWKQHAQKEKEKLTGADKTATGSADKRKATASSEELPPASLMTLVNSLVIQTLYSLGRLGDPDSKETPPVNLDLAKHHIDMLGVLEEKTKGNLSAEETRALSMALHEMRMLYVQTAS